MDVSEELLTSTEGDSLRVIISQEVSDSHTLTSHTVSVTVSVIYYQCVYKTSPPSSFMKPTETKQLTLIPNSIK